MRGRILYLLVSLLTILVGFCSLALSPLNHCPDQQDVGQRLDTMPVSSTTISDYYSEPTKKSFMTEKINELTTVTHATTHVTDSQIPRWLQRVKSAETAFKIEFHSYKAANKYEYEMYMYYQSTKSVLKDLMPKIYASYTIKRPLHNSKIPYDFFVYARTHFRKLQDITFALWRRKYPRDYRSKSNYCPTLCQQTHELFEKDNGASYMHIRNDFAFGEQQREIMTLIDASYYLVFTLTNLCVNEYQSELIKDPRLRNIAKQIDVSSNDIGQILKNGKFKKDVGERPIRIKTIYFQKKNKN